ncbi:hypothetical protein ACFYRC_25705 [Streptomyces sp. NPDC005279]|uniref:hypothetical protein n=1 Tax=Streptomyces sp. NPDC005279 TaxID=3364712 RepID=UPI0036CA6FF0
MAVLAVSPESSLAGGLGGSAGDFHPEDGSGAAVRCRREEEGEADPAVAVGQGVGDQFSRE